MIANFEGNMADFLLDSLDYLSYPNEMFCLLICSNNFEMLKPHFVDLEFVITGDFVQLKWSLL